ncbi:unnamed protein product [Lathyrus oleraceus]
MVNFAVQLQNSVFVATLKAYACCSGCSFHSPFTVVFIGREEPPHNLFALIAVEIMASSFPERTPVLAWSLERS